jgi:hypothetical protein
VAPIDINREKSSEEDARDKGSVKSRHVLLLLTVDTIGLKPKG